MCLWSNTIVWFSSISVWVLLGEPSLKWLYPLQWTHTLMHLGLPACAGLSRLLEDCPQTVVPCFIIPCWLLMKYWDHTQLMSGTGLYQEGGGLLTSASEPHSWSVCCVGLKVWCFHCQYSSVLLLGAKILALFIPALCKNNYTLYMPRSWGNIPSSRSWPDRWLTWLQRSPRVHEFGCRVAISFSTCEASNLYQFLC